MRENQFFNIPISESTQYINLHPSFIFDELRISVYGDYDSPNPDPLIVWSDLIDGYIGVAGHQIVAASDPFIHYNTLGDGIRFIWSTKAFLNGSYRIEFSRFNDGSIANYTGNIYILIEYIVNESKAYI